MEAERAADKIRLRCVKRRGGVGAESKAAEGTGKEAKREMWVSWARPPDPSRLPGRRLSCAPSTRNKSWKVLRSIIYYPAAVAGAHRRFETHGLSWAKLHRVLLRSNNTCDYSASQQLGDTEQTKQGFFTPCISFLVASVRDQCALIISQILVWIGKCLLGIVLLI